jgi:hypothetical protein
MRLWLENVYLTGYVGAEVESRGTQILDVVISPMQELSWYLSHLLWGSFVSSAERFRSVKHRWLCFGTLGWRLRCKSTRGCSCEEVGSRGCLGYA